jgi:intergrase/recombinase
VQEVVLAQKMLLQCGEESGHWKCLCGLIDACEGLYSAHREASSRQKLLLDIIESTAAELRKEWKTQWIRRNTKMNEYKSWISLCQVYKWSLCQDQRDKILALRALAATCCQDAVQADYSLFLVALCAELLRYMFACHRSLYSKQAAARLLETLGLSSRYHLSTPVPNDSMIRKMERLCKKDFLLVIDSDTAIKRTWQNHVREFMPTDRR